MNPLRHLRLILGNARQRLVQYVQAHRIRYRYPTLHAHPTSIWDYGRHDIDSVVLGEHVSVGAYAEIVVQYRSIRSPHRGSLVLGDRVLLTAGVNIRAAGGVVRIGDRCGIGQHTTIVAANHSIRAGTDYMYSDWDSALVDVVVGRNVWVGAGCVLVPGCRIGDNSVIAAGSVVRGVVPANEVWGGVPAKRLRSIDGPMGAPGDGEGPSPT